jgi:hypothetical protein
MSGQEGTRHAYLTGGSGATLTTEQRAKIRETGPKASNVNFSISVGHGSAEDGARHCGPADPRAVARPRYFVVGDEMIIVDSKNRIVAVIAL